MAPIKKIINLVGEYALKMPSVEQVVEKGKTYAAKYAKPFTYSNSKGDLIVRKYRNYRTLMNQATTAQLSSMSFATCMYQESGILSKILAFLSSAACVASSKAYANALKAAGKYRPEYKVIKAKAKSIAKAAKKRAKEEKEAAKKAAQETLPTRKSGEVAKNIDKVA